MSELGFQDLSRSFELLVGGGWLGGFVDRLAGLGALDGQALCISARFDAVL